ncbi:MAG: InlB B-repeat-containing protein [Clostridiales bacterium]|nr:InlB B-repeat-containing protein [Clostridiales bacterium]
MKKSKLVAAALAATMFTTAACCLVACGDADLPNDTRHVISFNAAGGTLNGAEALYINKDGYVKGAIPTAEKDDTTFRGWALTIGATDDSAVIDFTKQKFDKDTVVYAVYKNYEVVTITYDYGAGIGTRGSDKTVNGKLATLPTPTPPTNQTFKGWYTAATGGTEVTVDTVFTENGTIYAQYTAQSTAELTNYCLVGETKYELEEVTLEDATQAFTVTVNLQADDNVSFYVDGQVITATKGSVWIGMKPSVGKKDVFTAERAGSFEFNLTLTGTTTPTWTVTGDDGTIIAVKGDYYLVGKDFGNWSSCLPEYHIGSTTGSFELTVGAKPVAFKIAKAADRLGTIEWGGALDANCVTVGAGFLSIDHESDGSANTNIRLETAGKYTITLAGGEVEITSDDVTEPEKKAEKDHYYLVGKGVEYGNWAECLEEWYIGETEGEIQITVGTTPVAFKIVKCGNAYTGAINWDGPLGIGAVSVGKGYASTDSDKNVVLKTAGTYTVTLAGGKIEITSDLPEPELTKDIDGYTYGPIDGTKFYLVGGFIGEEFDAANGYEMKVKDNGEYMVEGFSVEAGGAVKIVIGDEEYGYADVHAEWGNKGLADTDEDGNIVFKAAGIYSIFINPTTHEIYLSA